MKKIILISCGTMLGVGGYAVLKAVEVPVARFTVRVTDEAGKPLDGVAVKGGFGLPYDSWSGGNQKSGHSWIEKTNQHGLVAFEGKSTGDGGAVVSVDGYYWHRESVQFKQEEHGRWQPWNPTVELVLRAVLKPVKMHAKHMDLASVPLSDRPLGFDMAVGDWVAPHGKGRTADMFYLKHHNEISQEDSDFHVEITFPNRGDGIQRFAARKNQGSAFISPGFAPESGYEPKYRSFQFRRKGRATEGNMGTGNDRFFFLRIRTELDGNGNVKSACYAKIYGDIHQFDYFFNPTPNDRNMEYGGNLIRNLGSLEKPHGP